MNAFADNLSSQLRSTLLDFAGRVRAVSPALVCDFGSSKNDAFLLRVYLSLSLRGDGEEVAVTVDVMVTEDVLNIVSDVCQDSGQVIAVGPSAAIPWDGDQPTQNDTLTIWLREFNKFLSDSESKVVEIASTLL
jgi:hypothetical protein